MIYPGLEGDGRRYLIFAYAIRLTPSATCLNSPDSCLHLTFPSNKTLQHTESGFIFGFPNRPSLTRKFLGVDCPSTTILATKTTFDDDIYPFRTRSGVPEIHKSTT